MLAALLMFRLVCFTGREELTLVLGLNLGGVGFTPAWARGTATRGTCTRERYRPHYSSTSARALVGTLRTLVVFSLEDIMSQSLQMVSGVSPWRLVVAYTI